MWFEFEYICATAQFLKIFYNICEMWDEITRNKRMLKGLPISSAGFHPHFICNGCHIYCFSFYSLSLGGLGVIRRIQFIEVWLFELLIRPFIHILEIQLLNMAVNTTHHHVGFRSQGYCAKSKTAIDTYSTLYRIQWICFASFAIVCCIISLSILELFRSVYIYSILLLLFLFLSSSKPFRCFSFLFPCQ